MSCHNWSTYILFISCVGPVMMLQKKALLKCFLTLCIGPLSSVDPPMAHLQNESSFVTCASSNYIMSTIPVLGVIQTEIALA